MFGKKRKLYMINLVVPERTDDEQALLDRVIAWTNDGTLAWTGTSDYAVTSMQSSPATFRVSGCTLYVSDDNVGIVIDRVCPELTDAIDRARDAQRAALIQRLVAQ